MRGKELFFSFREINIKIKLANVKPSVRDSWMCIYGERNLLNLIQMECQLIARAA